jgi:hypothetical protein
MAGLHTVIEYAAFQAQLLPVRMFTAGPKMVAPAS